MGKLSRRGGLLYFLILMAFVVIFVRVLSAGHPGARELNSQQFLAEVQTHEFVSNPPNRYNQRTVHDGDQEVTLEHPDACAQVQLRYPPSERVVPG